jgi:hypothetical protein
MATATKDKVEQTKSTDKAPETKKASKPQAPYFGKLGTNSDLEKLLEGLDQPVRRGTWSAKVVFMLLSQGADATEASIAQAWAEAVEKLGETFPGKDGLYHGKDEDHARKTVLQSTQFGTRRALRDLHNKGLVRVEDGKIVIRSPLTRLVGKVEASASRPARRATSKVSTRKGRSARTSS